MVQAAQVSRHQTLALTHADLHSSVGCRSHQAQDGFIYGTNAKCSQYGISNSADHWNGTADNSCQSIYAIAYSSFILSTLSRLV